VWKALVFDADQFRCGLRRAHARRRDSGDRLAVVTHEWVTLVRFRARIAQLRDRQHAIENVYGLDAGRSLRSGSIDRLDAGVRHSAADDACVQHARKLYVVCVTSLARDLRHGVDAVDGFADDSQLRIRRQLGRLVGRNVARDGLQRLADDSRQNGAVAHVSPPLLR
jgi:hypothetical protein